MKAWFMTKWEGKSVVLCKKKKTKKERKRRGRNGGGELSGRL
jgi:hypothetical protein